MTLFYEDLFKDENKDKLDNVIAFFAVANMSNIQYERHLAEPLLFDKKLFLTVAQKYGMDLEISDEEYKEVFDSIQEYVKENKEELADILVGWVIDDKSQKILKEIETDFHIPLLEDMGNFIQDFKKKLEDQEQASNEEQHILPEDDHIQDRPFEKAFKLFSYLAREASKQERHQIGSSKLSAIAGDICREEIWGKDFGSWKDDELKQLFDIDKPVGYEELLDFYMYEPNQDLMKHVLEEAIYSHEDNVRKNIVNLEEGIWAKLRRISLTKEQRSAVEQAHEKFLAFQTERKSWQQEEDKEMESLQWEAQDEEMEPSQREAQDKEAIENYMNAKAFVDSFTTQEAIDVRVAQFFEHRGDENNFLKQYWALAKYELSQAEGTSKYVKIKKTVTDFLGNRMVPKLVDDIMDHISDSIIKDIVGTEPGKDDRARLKKDVEAKLQEHFKEALEHVVVVAHPVMEDQEYDGLLKFISNYSESIKDPVARRIESVQEEKAWKQRERKAKAELEKLIQRYENRVDDVLASPGNEDIRRYIRNAKSLEEEEFKKLQENGVTQERQAEFENLKDQLKQSSADLIMSRMKETIDFGISNIDLEGMSRSQDKDVIENLKKQIQSAVEKHIYDKIVSSLQNKEVQPEKTSNVMPSEPKVEDADNPKQTEVQNKKEKTQNVVEKNANQDAVNEVDEQVPIDSELRMVEVDVVEINRNLHSLLEQLQDADPFYIRSSPEFKNMKELLTTMVQELDNRGEFLDSEGLRELATGMETLRTRTDEYLTMKNKEEKPSNNARRRMAVANRIRNAANKYVAPLSAVFNGDKVEVVKDTDKIREVLQQSRRKEAQEVDKMPEGLGKDIAKNALLARERLEQYACSKVALRESEQRDAKNCLHFLISNRLVQMQIKKQVTLDLEEEVPKIIKAVSQMEEFNVDRYTKDPKSIAEFLSNHEENKMIKECIATIAQTLENHEQVREHSHPQLNHQENVNKKVKGL